MLRIGLGLLVGFVCWNSVLAQPELPPPTTVQPTRFATETPATMAAPVQTGPITIPDALQQDLQAKPGLEGFKPLQPLPQPERNWFHESWETKNNPLGPVWGRDELLLWWIKPNNLPPLALGTRSNTTPFLGQPDTTILIGNQTLSTSLQAGGLFSFGWSFDNQQTTGIEFIYFFLGTRTTSLIRGTPFLDSPQAISRPFATSDFPGDEGAIPVALPGLFRGGINVSLSTRMTGWEINGVGNLLATNRFQLDALVGYRYLALNQGLRMEQQSWRMDPVALPVAINIADQIDAHNSFHGGQIGLRSEIRGQTTFVELSGKLGIGTNNQKIRISGTTVTATPGLLPNFQQGGVFGLPSNSGRFTQSPFSLLPEASVKVGFLLGNSARFYVGYNLLYLTQAIQPADQIDRVLNIQQIPAFRSTMPGFGPDRPLVPFRDTSIWAQGLMIGLESRF